METKQYPKGLSWEGQCWIRTSNIDINPKWQVGWAAGRRILQSLYWPAPHQRTQSKRISFRRYGNWFAGKGKSSIGTAITRGAGHGL